MVQGKFYYSSLYLLSLLILKESSFSMASKQFARLLIFLENETLLFALLACECILFDLYFQFVPVIVHQKGYHAQSVACQSQGKY